MNERPNLGEVERRAEREISEDPPTVTALCEALRRCHDVLSALVTESMDSETRATVRHHLERLERQIDFTEAVE